MFPKNIVNALINLPFICHCFEYTALLLSMCFHRKKGQVTSQHCDPSVFVNLVIMFIWFQTSCGDKRSSLSPDSQSPPPHLHNRESKGHLVISRNHGCCVLQHFNTHGDKKLYIQYIQIIFFWITQCRRVYKSYCIMIYIAFKSVRPEPCVWTLNTLHRLCGETYEEICLNFKDAVHIVYTVPCAIAASLIFSSGLSCSIVWITGKSACLSLPDRKKMNCRRTFFRYSRLATLFSLSWFRSRRRTSLFNN